MYTYQIDIIRIYEVRFREIPGVTQVEKRHSGITAVATAY